MMSEPICRICKAPVNDLPNVSLTVKGSESINKVSKEQSSSVETKPGHVVHVDCRRDFIHPRNSFTPIKSLCHDNGKNLRSNKNFDFKKNCLFCNQTAKFDHRKRGKDVFPVRTLEFQQSIVKKCEERADEWADNVLGVVSQALDLPAAEARYHQKCNVNFRTGRQIPKMFDDANGVKISHIGRPENQDVTAAFNDLVKYIKASGHRPIQLKHLVEKMQEMCGENAYSSKYLKKRILEHFGQSITVCSKEGKGDIFSLQETTSSLIHEFLKNEQNQSEEEKKNSIMKTAAKLISADIVSMKASKEAYPTFTSIGSVEQNIKYVPDSLRLFLANLIPGDDVKIGSIGQAIVQACRPRSLMAPLQLGLAVQMHHHFGSKYLIEVLNSLGFCLSYWETQKYEACAAASVHENLAAFFPGHFTQFVADNVDHNIRTLDGHGTFHGMGIIASTTPGYSIDMTVVRRNVSMEELQSLAKVEIKYFVHPKATDLIPIHFRDIPEALPDQRCNFDVFSKILWPINNLRPSWSGFMQLYDKPCDVIHPGKSSIAFLPMIDMNPSDASCILSTMNFVSDLSRKHSVTPVLTFDQPLFLKATNILNVQQSDSYLKKIVLRLGAFHTEMSFLSAIGHIMGGSGLQDLLETVYAPNAVVHMLSGKAVARAVRGHFLIDTALHTLLLEKAFHVDIVSALLNENGDEPKTINVEVTDQKELTAMKIAYEDVKQNVQELYDSLKEGEVSKSEVCMNTNIQDLVTTISEEEDHLRQYRTPALWIQYMDMISILQQFIRAERTGNWIGHLVALRKMLPYFAATGHSLYLKSAYIYLQNMHELENSHPEVHKEFLDGKHVIRRSDRYWAGISTDLAIEQVLMRSLKTSGGLTRGRGMTEGQRALWLLSMPATAEMNVVMQQYTGKIYTTSEQYKEESKSRTCRDTKDVKSFLSFLKEQNPFEAKSKVLQNIVTGVTADEKVNAEKAEKIGSALVSEMVGNTLDEYKYRRSRQIVTVRRHFCQGNRRFYRNRPTVTLSATHHCSK